MNLTTVKSTLAIAKHTPIKVVGFNQIEAAVNTCDGLTTYAIPADTYCDNAVITNGILYHYDSTAVGTRLYLSEGTITDVPANQEIGLVVKNGQLLLNLSYRSTFKPRKYATVGPGPVVLPHEAMVDSLMVFVDIDYWEKGTEYTEDLNASGNVTGITPIIPFPTGSLIRIQYFSTT